MLRPLGRPKGRRNQVKKTVVKTATVTAFEAKQLRKDAHAEKHRIFESEFSTLWKTAYKYARSLRLDHHDAEDVVQNAYVHLLTRLNEAVPLPTHPLPALLGSVRWEMYRLVDRREVRTRLAEPFAYHLAVTASPETAEL